MIAIKSISKRFRVKMKISHHQNRYGFTIVELMIAVTIIALLAGIAVPSYARSRKRGQAVRVLEDLRMLDYALDRWAIENNKAPGDIASLSDLRPYIKTGSQLSGGTDVFGNSYGNTFSVDNMPKVPTPTYDTLSDVAPASFWSPYR